MYSGIFMSDNAPLSRPIRTRQNAQASCKKPDLSKLVALRAARAALAAKNAAGVEVKNDAIDDAVAKKCEY